MQVERIVSKLIVWNIISLDGFFEGPEKWDLELHEHIWGDELRELSLGFGEDLGLLVFGRVTYEGMAEHWPNDTTEPEIAEYMNAVPKLVGSRTLTDPAWSNTEVTTDIVSELTERKRQAERPIYVFGSGEITNALLAAGLVDELLIGISPVLLGRGTPLFEPATELRPLDLLEARPLRTGGVVLRYLVPA